MYYLNNFKNSEIQFVSHIDDKISENTNICLQCHQFFFISWIFVVEQFGYLSENVEIW